MANVLGCSVGSGSVRKPGKRTFSWVDEEIMKVRNPFAGLLALFFVVAWCLSGSGSVRQAPCASSHGMARRA